MTAFSIVICTYNPQPKVFHRLLNAVLQFHNSSPAHEVIIVDNNSSPAIREDQTVQQFLSKKPKTKIIIEKEAGLTAARIAGIKSASHDWLVFFDDDNEPSPEYIIECEKVINQFPQVGVWGPGKIKVNFIGRKETQFLQSQKGLFQERNMTSIVFDNNKTEGNECYPYGTGLIMKKNILESYVYAVKNNELTMTDRKSGSLSSGGDTQMLYQALKMGYYAGSAPSIKLTHNILPAKVRLLNLLKLLYHINAGQVKAYNEVFTDHPYPISQIKTKMIFDIIFRFLKRILKHPAKMRYELLDLSKKLGMVKAQIVAGNQRSYFLISLWEKIIKA